VASSSTSSSRRVFFAKLVVFALVTIGLDAGVGSLLRHYYFKQVAGLNYRTTYAVEQSRDDIIILGSSRAQAHYVPSILESGLGGTCYNAGRNGQSLLYAAAVHHSILARQAPRVVILDLIPTDFFQYHGHYDRLAALLPYYKDTEAVRPFVRLRSRLEPVKLLSRIYPFNSLPLQIIKYNLVPPAQDKGFIAQHGRIRLPLHPPKGRAWLVNGLDPQMLDAFTELVATCQENGIELYPVISPAFPGKMFGEDAVSELERILEGTPYRLWNYADHPEFVLNTELFSDRDHLNQDGAEAYTKIVVDRINAQPAPVSIDRRASLSGTAKPK
jgi:hypothetical protein